MISLDKSRFLARGALLIEAVWPALWPPLGVAGLFLCVALLDLLPLLPSWAHAAVLAATIVAIAALLYTGLRHVRLPDQAAADRRLEAASGLSHRPLTTLSDRPARIDDDAAALWQAHVARAASQIEGLKIGNPRPGLSRKDPKALRAAVILALVACFTVAGQDAPGRIAAALHPALTPLTLSVPPELRVWITPPPYTRLPPVFLRPEVQTVSVPVGSHLTVSLTGESGTPTLSLDGERENLRTLDTGSFQGERDLTASGSLKILSGAATLGQWTLTAIPDRPPAVSWASPPGPGQGNQETRLPWKAEDDYGLVSLRAELRLQGRPDAEPLVVVIPVPAGAAKSAKGVNQQDLTAHPWAGLPVVATLVGKDFPGQTGTSNPSIFVLPERTFLNPVSKMLIQVRKGLSLHPDDRGDEMEVLDTAMQKPDVFGDDLGAWANLSGIYYKLVHSKTDADIAEAQERLWQLALHLEEGQTESTARALEEARAAAKEALETLLKEPTQINREALDARLQELKEAIDRQMQALIEEARRNGELPPMSADARPLTQQEMQRLADRTRDAAKTGTPEDAQRRMAELERMLDQLRNAKPGAQNQQNAEQRQRGRQQMGAVQDMVGREGGLLDHTEGRVDQTMKFNRPPPTAADPNATREADRRVQQALRRSLGELMQQFGDLAGEIPPSLGEADQAMREAGTALGQGRDKAAGDAVQQAIEALQKGARDMAQTMQKKFGPPQPGSGEGEGEGDEALFGMTMPGGQQAGRTDGSRPGEPGQADSRGRDPLGRTTGNGTAGSDETGDVTVPEERERQKALAIQEELRRREAEKTRPQPELDYIDRLLKQF
jgi:uncharacterized protein (TIGR02302 family)